MKRVFLIVLDGFGIGEMPDSGDYGDVGANTLATISKHAYPKTLATMGLYNIEGVTCGVPFLAPVASFARIAEQSAGKDTTIGHWEIAGIISKTPLPKYPNGFPASLIQEFEKLTNTKVICNKPYSGTQAIADYGREHVMDGSVIVYTSADSVFQIAAHEKYFGLERLYECCEIARKLLVGEHGVGRVIARPFLGEIPDFSRTSNRHDYSLVPPKPTMLNAISEAGMDVIGVGKIHDIFSGSGITRTIKTTSNLDGMEKVSQIGDFNGLCFVNLVDFDMLYGHRNNINGYAEALMDFDSCLRAFLSDLKPEDTLIITADHGCDPGFSGTDHTREYVPMIAYGAGIKPDIDLGTLTSFSDIGATVLDILDVKGDISGTSFYSKIKRR